MTDLGLFLKQAVSNPHQIFALAPSSKSLARRMAEAVPEGPGNVIELGPGTGKITSALIEAGVPVNTIHSFEINPRFCDHLKLEFPDLHVHQDRAENLGKHSIDNVKAVVSGLPLLSMNQDIQRAIVGAAFEVLQPGGLYIQFTYGPVPPVKKVIREELSLSWTRSEKIWGNLPPATSYTFYRSKVS